MCEINKPINQYSDNLSSYVLHYEPLLSYRFDNAFSFMIIIDLSFLMSYVHLLLPYKDVL